MSKTLFLLGCIPTRILLAYIAFKFSHNPYIKYILSLITFMIGVGFIYIYKTGSRKTGIETEGKPIWWNNMRPIHGTIYLLFSILTLSNVRFSWILLVLDVILGLGAFTMHYYL